MSNDKNASVAWAEAIHFRQQINAMLLAHWSNDNLNKAEAKVVRKYFRSCSPSGQNMRAKKSQPMMTTNAFRQMKEELPPYRV